MNLPAFIACVEGKSITLTNNHQILAITAATLKLRPRLHRWRHPKAWPVAVAPDALLYDWLARLAVVNEIIIAVAAVIGFQIVMNNNIAGNKVGVATSRAFHLVTWPRNKVRDRPLFGEGASGSGVDRKMEMVSAHADRRSTKG